MPAIQIPDTIETINGFLRGYHFGGDRLVEGFDGLESSIVFFEGPRGRIFEPQTDEKEPFSRRINISRKILELAADRPDILQNEEILWGIAVSLGLKLQA